MEPACPGRPQPLVGTPFQQSPLSCWQLPVAARPLTPGLPVSPQSDPARLGPPCCSLWPPSVAHSFWHMKGHECTRASQGSLQLRPCVPYWRVHACAHRAYVSTARSHPTLRLRHQGLSGSTFRMFLGSDHLLPCCLPSPWPGLSLGSGSVLRPQGLPLLAVLEPSECPPPSSLLSLNLPGLTRVPLGVGEDCRGMELPSHSVLVLELGAGGFFIRRT